MDDKSFRSKVKEAQIIQVWSNALKAYNAVDIRPNLVKLLLNYLTIILIWHMTLYD